MFSLSKNIFALYSYFKGGKCEQTWLPRLEIQFVQILDFFIHRGLTKHLHKLSHFPLLPSPPSFLPDGWSSVAAKIPTALGKKNLEQDDR